MCDAKAEEGRKGINCYLEQDVYDMLEDHCERTGQSKTVAIERAVKMYVEAELEKERLVEQAQAGNRFLI